MKKIKLIISILLLALSVSLLAQEPKMQLANYESPNGRKIRAAVDYNMYSGDNESEFYVIESGRLGYDIAVFDAESMARKSSFAIEEPEEGNRQPRWVRFFFHSEKITMVYAIFDKRADKFTVYGKIMDQSGTIELESTILMEIKAERKKDIGSISFRLSEDNTKILLFREPRGKRFDKEKMELALFDYNLNQLFDRKMSFPYKYQSIVVEDIDVANNGKVIIVTQYSEPEKRGSRRSRGPVNEMVNKIFTMSDGNDELLEIEIEQKGYAFSSLNGYVLNDQGKMMFTGFYRDAKSVRRRSDSHKGANGIYYITLDLAADTIEKRVYDKLDKESMAKILGANTTEKRGKKSVDKGYGLRSFDIKNVFYSDSGEIMITLEKSYVIENCRTDQNGITTCTYTYYDMELVEIILNGEGKIVSTQVIPKKQISRTSRYHSVITLEDNGKVYYVYNDTEKNVSPKKTRPGDDAGFQYTYSSSTRLFGNNKKRLVAVTVGEDGSLKKEPLTPSFKQNVTIFPKSDNARLENNTWIVWGYDVRAKKITLVKLYLEE